MNNMTLNDFIEEKEEELESSMPSLKVDRVGGVFNGDRPVHFKEDDSIAQVARLLLQSPGFRDWLRSALRECAEKTVEVVCRLPSGTYVQGLNAAAWLGSPKEEKHEKS